VEFGAGINGQPTEEQCTDAIVQLRWG